MRVAPVIVLDEKQREVLTRLARGRRTPVRLAMRARIVLLAADGLDNHEIAEHVGLGRVAVGRWRSRFSEGGLSAIEKDLPRGGRGVAGYEEIESEILRKTTQEKPKNATHWSVRTLARELGTTRSRVHRVWKAHGLKPHLVRTFKVSNDPRFEEKLRDVVGLYLNPPENALVLSADEKTQCQALDRTQPSLPLVKGRCGTMTHDYKRNGTTTLFAAIDMTRGQVIATCMPRHRHQEWINFLKLIDQGTPSELELHVIADNLATHKHPKVQRWLKRHPRFHMHFTPTSSSWLNVIERFFRDLTQKRLRRGVFRCVPELIEAMMAYVAAHNEEPRPFVWTAAVEQILDKVGRARDALKSTQQSGTHH